MARARRGQIAVSLASAAAMRALSQLVLLLGRVRPEEQRRRGRRVGEMRVEPGFVDAVEEGKERVVVALRDRIELVIVATRALERQPEHRGAERVHAIDDVLGAKLVLDAAALVRLPVQPVEGGGDALVARRVRQQIAGKLPEEELIVGQVLVERRMTQSRYGDMSRSTSA